MRYSPPIATLPQEAFPSGVKSHWWKAVVLLILLTWLYLPIASRLIAEWWNDPNYSHGFLVPFFSLFVLWRERRRLAELTPEPSVAGFPILIVAMLVLVLGVLGSELFLSRVSLLLLLAGLIISFLGLRYFRALLFPWAFLFLMVPIPELLFNKVTFPLQILASKFAAALLPLLGVPVLREGNIINLPSMSLEVAQACSGIRSLLSLVTLAVAYGFLTEVRKPIRLLLILASVPIAVAANSVRIVGSGVLAQYWDPTKAEGFFHSFSGWLVFLVSLAALFLLHRFLRSFERLREAHADGI